MICELGAICIDRISTEGYYFNQCYASVLSAKLQRSIKKVVGGEKNKTLPPSGIEPRMLSPGIVHSMHSAYWTHIY